MFARKRYMKVKAVIIGCGKVAGGYDTLRSKKIRTHAKAYLDNNKTELVGVCDKNIQTASRFAQKWKVPFYSNSVNEILSKCQPDIVSICSNTESHYTIAKQIIAFGIKNIWMEKPSSNNLKDTHSLSRLIKRNKINFVVSYYRRHEKALVGLNNEIKKIGPIQNIRALYTKGLRNNGSHLLDFLLFYFSNYSKIKIINKLNDQSYPSVSFILKNKKFNIEIIALDHSRFEIFEVDIIGSHGRIHLSDGFRKIDFYKKKKSKYFYGYETLELSRSIKISYDRSFKKILENIINKKSYTGVVSELKVMKIIDKVEASLDTK